MNVFISWAGPTSQAMALLLRKYLPAMLQGLKVFVSKGDIGSGERWPERLGEELAQSNFGILCLTPKSAQSQWLLFEAGALTKLPEGRACGLLLGMSPGDVTWPLAQFQHKPFEGEYFKELLHDLNRLMTPSLPTETVDLIYDQWWGKVEGELAAIPKELVAAEVAQRRAPEEQLEELIALIRTMDRRIEQALPERPLHGSNAITGAVSRQGRRKRLLELPEDVFVVVMKLAVLTKLAQQEELSRIDGELIKLMLEHRVLQSSDEGLRLGFWAKLAATELIRDNPRSEESKVK